VGQDKSRYSLGSVLNFVLLHQTVIGQEVEKQLQMAGAEADVAIGCVGGGSNFGGFMLPLYCRKKKKNLKTRFVAAEPTAAPSITKGKYKYDFGDTAGLSPLLMMHTLGKDFVPSPIHAGGLRYHGMAPIISLLAEAGEIEAKAYSQREVFEAAQTFARTEGVVVAPETAHAVRAAIDEALAAKRAGEERNIVFNLSGHGLLDLGGYRDFLDGKL
jgi:tryptophan synthase beta chain